MRSLLPLPCVLVLLACGDKPWSRKDAPSIPPDEQFRTGHEAGYDAWIWHCYAGQRIVITQSSSALLGASAPRTTRGPCGAPLALEAGFPPPRRRYPVPPSVRWPGSKPDPEPDMSVDAASVHD